MSAELDVFFSHRVETLYERMKTRLFRKDGHPFARKCVIVPSPAMKTWLHLTLAKDPACGIAAGLDVGCVGQAINKLLEGVIPSKMRELSRLELAFLIEEQLALALGQEDPLWLPVKNFIGKSLLGYKAQKRLTALSFQLADLFEKYGLYGSPLLAAGAWEKIGWQEELWRRVWQAAPKRTYPSRLLEEAMGAPPQHLVNAHTEIHLFSINFLPALHHQLLRHLASFIPVHYYILSPCQAFWSNISSDCQSRRLYTHWKAKEATTPTPLSALEGFLRDRNPLLANFCRLGREMAEQLEKANCRVDEEFSMPLLLSEMSPYRELIGGNLLLENTLSRPTLLDYLQADLTLLRNPLDGEKIAFSPEDRSIQLHANPTKRREIESLHDLLMGVIDRHKEEADPITPGDIIVMAPDLIEYEPFIKAIFDAADHPLAYQLMEVELLSKSPFVQAFLQLLALASTRWDAVSLIEIFELPYVQNKCRFSADDVRKFRQWIKEAAIRWGEDASHCNEILQREMCDSSLADGDQPGTWQAGVDRLLAGLALTHAGGNKFTQYAPLESVDASGAELLGRWLELLKALREDLKPLHDGTLLQMDQWMAYLLALMDAYLLLDCADREELENKQELIGELNKLGQAASPLGQHRYSFQSAKMYIDQVLHAKRVNYREGHLKAVRFCSLQSMRTWPAKVVVLIGMQDSAFPKTDVSNGLDLLAGASEAEYAPLRADSARSLFLESLLSARRYFMMSYVNYDKGKEEAPSALVTELMTYLDGAYHAEGQKPSKLCVHSHPLQAFDASCFSPHSAFPSYSKRAFDAARAYYHHDKEPRHQFIPSFTRRKETLVPKSLSSVEVIDVKDLGRMSKNPLQIYFNKTLKIYVNEVSNRHVEVDEPFDLDFLGMHLLKEKSLFAEVKDVLRQSKKEGLLPSGLFHEVISDKLTEQAETIDLHLSSMGIAKSGIFQVTMAAHCQHPIQTDNGWTCPPLRVEMDNGRTVTIVGKLQNVVSQGLLVFKERKFADIVQVWPQFLILEALIKECHLPIQAALLLLKDGERLAFEEMDLTQALQDFLVYYELALKEISPLDPQWLKDILQSNVEGLDKTMRNNLGRSEQHFFNAYAKWSFDGQEGIPHGPTIVEHWREVAAQVFRPLDFVLSRKDDD